MNGIEWDRLDVEWQNGVVFAWFTSNPLQKNVYYFDVNGQLGDWAQNFPKGQRSS
jgi:hypothetical protein